MKKQADLSGNKILALLATLAFVAICSCSKKEEEKGSSAAASQAPVKISKESVISLVPTSAYGFMLFDSESEGWKKYISSSWAKSPSSMVDMKTLGTSSPVLASLEKAGFDITKPETLVADVTSFAVFIAPGSTKGIPSLGAVAKLRPGNSLEKKIQTLKTELASSSPNLTISDISITGNKGFKIENKNSKNVSDVVSAKAGLSETLAGSSKLSSGYFGWNESYLAVSSKEETLNQLLQKDSGQLPEIVSSEGFKAASSSQTDAASSYVNGYLDLARIVKDNFNPETSSKLEKFPFKFLSFSNSMDSTPRMKARLTYDPAAIPQNLNASSAEKAIGMLNQSPMFLLSLDGSILKSLFDMATKNETGAANPMIQAYAAPIASIKRISISASSPSLGQSMLPIPNIVLAFDSSNPAEIKNLLSNLGSVAAASAQGMTSGTWNKKIVEGIEVNSIDSPMGVGLHLASMNDVVIAASSGQQISDLIQVSKGTQASATKSLPTEVSAAFAKGNNIAQIFLNLPELSKFLKSIRDVAGMYLRNQEANKMFSDEQLAGMEKLGMYTASVENGSGYFAIEGFYSTSPQSGM